MTSQDRREQNTGTFRSRIGNGNRLPVSSLFLLSGFVREYILFVGSNRVSEIIENTLRRNDSQNIETLYPLRRVCTSSLSSQQTIDNMLLLSSSTGHGIIIHHCIPSRLWTRKKQWMELHEWSTTERRDSWWGPRRTHHFSCSTIPDSVLSP